MNFDHCAILASFLRPQDALQRRCSFRDGKISASLLVSFILTFFHKTKTDKILSEATLYFAFCILHSERRPFILHSAFPLNFPFLLATSYFLLKKPLVILHIIPCPFIVNFHSFLFLKQNCKKLWQNRPECDIIFN